MNSLALPKNDLVADENLPPKSRRMLAYDGSFYGFTAAQRSQYAIFIVTTHPRAWKTLFSFLPVALAVAE